MKEVLKSVEEGDRIDLDVQGSILDQEPRIGEGRQKVGIVSKKWFRFCDTCGVEVAEGQDDILIPAVTVAIDMMAHQKGKWVRHG